MPNEEEEVIVVKRQQVVTRLDATNAAAVLRAAADALESGEIIAESPTETE